MRISLSIPEEFMVTNHGYGVVSQQIVQALQSLGHSVPYRDPSCQVEICIGQPNNWVWSSKRSYKIGYVAWESTRVPEKWKAPLTTCDELWATSPWVEQMFEKEGFPVTQVYQHGVDASTWRPKRRVAEGRPIRFLHIGEPAPRKGGQLTYDVFKDLYGNSDKANLTLKAFTMNTIRGQNNAHPFKELNNVKLRRDELSEFEMVSMVRSHDVLVYPSWGEGFGLIPLQAMATGMPVISTVDWCPYADLIPADLRVGSVPVDSPWPFHTGRMYKPLEYDLRLAMDEVVQDFEKFAESSYNLHKFVTKRYDWNRLTEDAFAHLVQKFES